MSPLEDVVDLAADQWGLVTTAQAEILGVHRHRLASAVSSGRMERIAHGVYAMAGVPDSPLTRLRAAYLGADAAATLAERKRRLPDSGVVSHTSAAVVHGLGTLRALRHEMTFPVRRQTQRREIKYHLMKIGSESITEVDRLPVTTVERTAADLLRSGVDEDHVALVLSDAEDRALLDRTALLKELAPVAHARGYDLDAWAQRLAPAPNLADVLAKRLAGTIPKDYLTRLDGLGDPMVAVRLREAGNAARRALEDLAIDTGMPVADLVAPMLAAGGLTTTHAQQAEPDDD